MKIGGVVTGGCFRYRGVIYRRVGPYLNELVTAGLIRRIDTLPRMEQGAQSWARGTQEDIVVQSQSTGAFYFAWVGTEIET